MRALNLQRRRVEKAFTLVEVILAIVIALGVFVVLLYFYQQATNLRSQAIQETERLAAARLVMDRITSELGAVGTCRLLNPSFRGTSNSVEFVKADVPAFSAWMGGALGRSVSPVTDLKLVRYRLQAEGGTNVGGLLRSEEPMVPKEEMEPAEDFEQVGRVADKSPGPVLEEIRFVQFRFWSGTNWLDSWSQATAPRGVEVTLGAESMTNGADIADYPGDLFRRVIYLAVTGLATGPIERPASRGGTAESEEVR